MRTPGSGTASAGSGFTQRVNISHTGDMETLVEDQVPAAAAPRRDVRDRGSTVWLAETVVFEHS